VASRIDGIQLMAPNAQRNIIRGNVIGESPQGQAAPLDRWGIVVRWGTANDEIRNNTIRNAAAGGIGMLVTGNNGQAMAPAHNVVLSRNIVTNTSGPAIFAPGALVNPPAITEASTSTVSGTAAEGATVEVFRASRPVGQNGLPVEYLGDAVAHGGTWSLDVSGVAQGDHGAESNIAPEVPAGFTATPGSAIAFRLRVVGTELRFRAWDAAAAEPGWLTTADDSTPALQGVLGVGLRVYTGSKVPNGPVQFTLDDFEMRIPS
jgi:hypothetical protein